MAAGRPTPDRLYEILDSVKDPEVPVLSVVELGVVRGVAVGDDGAVEVSITPTYSGCPAMDTIRSDVAFALAEAGYPDATVELVLSPAWTTDWMSEDGRAKLEEYGIAPPSGLTPVRRTGSVRVALAVKCPQCGSLDTRETSRFGSTSCKALYTCNACQEPFDYFKVL